MAPIKHGLARRGGKQHPLYSTWQSMIRRCDWSPHKDYHNYGGRGIAVCERWRNDFEAFLLDLGDRPSNKHTLDRINTDGNYEPGNCRWATLSEQAFNRRPFQHNKRIFYEGRSLTDIAIENGVRPSTVWKRFKRGVRGAPLFARDLRINNGGKRAP